MVDAIEVPGEANPLNAQNLLNCLAAAASSVQQQIQIGTQQLQHWEKQAGFYPLLQGAFLDHSLPLNIRQLSIIQLKNGIDRYWRKTATNAIKKEEKAIIKDRALKAGVIEPNPLLALHNALVIAKIMRFEFPNDEWSDALPFLISSLRSAAYDDAPTLHFPRTLIILLQVVKELSTARMQRVRTSLQSVTPEILQTLGGIYVQKVGTWTSLLEHNRADDPSLPELLGQTLMCLKVLRRLIIAGYEHPNRDKDVQGFWALSQSQSEKFFAFSEMSTNALNINALIKKHTLQISKLHVEMAKVHPAAFALLPDCVSLVKSYWVIVARLGESYDTEGSTQTAQTNADGESEKTFIEVLGLKALLLIRACAKMAFNPAHSFKYQRPEDKEEKKNAVDLIKSQLFTHDFVIMIMELVVSKFLRLRQADFQEWEDEPEEWERKEDTMSEAWEFSVRPCSEKLFLDLMIHFKQLLVPKLLDVFYRFASPQNPDILMKDSLYSAIGLAAGTLEQQLDFNAFMESALVPEVQINEQGYKVLRRRAAILIGQWIPIQPEKLNHQYIYQIFQHLLNRGDPLNDLPVRITAGRQLRNVLDQFELSLKEFLPYATPILQNLLTLIQEVELSETKMALLETVRTAVVRLEDQILPFSDQIMALLPPLWEQSGEEHLMKQAILTLLSSLMNALKSDSVKYHKDMIPLIRNSIEPESDTIVYLLEEALELWAAILTQTPAPASAEIISLFPRLLPIFQAATDSAPLALQIAESYILLCPQEMLHDEIRVPFLVSLEMLLSAASKQRLGAIPHLAEMLIRATEQIDGGSEDAYNTIAKSLLDSSFLQAILEGLHSAYEATQSTGPNRKTSYIYANLETDYFSVLARLALASPRVFLSAISAATATSEEQTLSWLLNEWFFHYDNIALATQKKLHVLALTQLLAANAAQGAAPPPYLLNHLQSYLTIWTDIVTELAEGSEDVPNSGTMNDSHAGKDYLIYWNKSDGVSNNNNNNAADDINSRHEAPENLRRHQWENSDAVHLINIRQFIQERLQAVMHACGGVQQFQDEWLVNVDQEVVNAFGALGIV